jgi:hypothetical protein
MTHAQPELLAVRAVNQYRRRDILTYLGLRLYLANRCALRDRWAKDAAGHLVHSQSKPCYFEASHFKEHLPGQPITHREIHLPGPNEALAEAALLQECARHPQSFQSLDCVFSYRLARGDYREGVFETYFAGFRERQEAIANACRKNLNGMVLYTDIQRFYPMISAELALHTWRQACQTAGLSKDYLTLGEKILAQHQAVEAPRCAGVLTGPMFSHLIGNLVLREVDAQMANLMPGHYFRYVDDFVLVGEAAQLTEARARLSSLLDDLGLNLHNGDKDFKVAAQDWLQGVDDVGENSQALNWKSFVGQLKQFLVKKPEQHSDLADAFDAAEMRIPLPDYSGTIKERGYLEKILNLGRRKWFRSKVREITVQSLIKMASELREGGKIRLRQNLDGFVDRKGYERKRRIPKLRYDAGRLLYLGRQRDLEEFSSILISIPEITLIGRVFGAVSRRDASSLLGVGTNAVQSAAQVLRLSTQPVRCQPEIWTNAERQGLAILRMNGIRLELGDNPDVPNDELNRLAAWDESGVALMRSADPFIREMACLHGADHPRRFDSMLDSAFDNDEALAFDAISQLNQSDSGLGY